MKNRKHSKDNKIKSNDLIFAMRSKSKDSSPSEEFTQSLENKLMNKLKSKYSIFRSKAIPLMFSVTLLMFLGGYIYFTRPYFPDSQYADSPLLDRLGIEPDSNLKSQKGFLERKSKDLKDSIGRLFTDSSEKESLSEADGLISGEVALDYDESPSPSAYNRQSPLQGGEIDDNEDFEDFLEYIENAEKGQAYDIDLKQRFYIKVKDNQDNGILGKQVHILDSEGLKYKLVTDSEGEIYFYPDAYKLNNEQMDNNQSQDEFTKYELTIDNKIYDFSSRDDEWIIEISKFQNAESLTLDLVFTIDSTGSMSDQINKLRDTITSISSRIHDNAKNITVRYGLVVYRDRQDEYITRIYDFTTDLDEFQKNLNAIEAAGGGDYPEDVNSALQDTMEQLSWSNKENAVKIAFLVADAPPHNDYGQEYDYRVAMLRAAEKGIKIFPLASSGLDNTEGEYVFRQLAAITNARYMFITNASGGTDYHVPEENYSVSNLDDLIVDVIMEEIEPTQ